jgi:hypothetical protein
MCIANAILYAALATATVVIYRVVRPTQRPVSPWLR